MQYAISSVILGKDNDDFGELDTDDEEQQVDVKVNLVDNEDTDSRVDD